MVSREESRKRAARRRNALQRYERERVRNMLAKPGEHDFVIVLDHLKAGYNIPKIFRSAQAFAAREIHLINIEPFDPSPAKGAFRKVPACFHSSFSDCFRELNKQGYTLFTLEAGCKRDLREITLPRKSAFILGNEGLGICFSRQDYPDVQCLSIPQFGSVESLNVSIAASVVMYEYIRQHHK